MSIINRTCTVNDAVGDDGTSDLYDKFMADGELTTFILTGPTSSSGGTQYQACYTGQKPPEFWTHPITLTCSGSVAPTLPPGIAPPMLKYPWQTVPAGQTPPEESDYTAACEKLRGWIEKNPSFFRLQGTVPIGDTLEPIVLCFFPAGVVNDKDFVLFIVDDVNAGGAEIRESGIAHGTF